MRRALLPLVSLFGLLSCDKPVPFEVVEAPRNMAPAPRLDASVPRDDAGIDAGPALVDAAVDESKFSKSALLKAQADCALAHYIDFRDKAQALSDASKLWATSSSADALAVARVAFRAALASWQYAQVFNVGPAAPSSQKGGKDLGDKIYYPQPSIDRCRIDQQLVKEDYSVKVLSARGLAAFEYLAYYAESQSSCSGGRAIDGWDALRAEDLAQRRASFAAAIAADVADLAGQLVDAWQPDSGNFYGELTEPGSGKIYSDQQDALNSLNNALFYVESNVKDLKLGRLLGKSGCTALTCPAALESPFAGLSADDISQNLIGLRQAFEGCKADFEGIGFDDYIHEANRDGDLSERMLARLKDAQTSVDTIGSLEAALDDDRSRVEDLYNKVKAFTDLFKTEFIQTTGLEAPISAAPDND